MNSTSRSFQNWKHLTSNPRFKAAAIGAVVLVAIVMMQVSSQKRAAPMCDLLPNCNLKAIDLHKMQIALSKSGLNEFQMSGNSILVPALKQAEYLQAVAEQGALPQELDSGKPAATAVPNPFLSRTQQLAVERDARKRHVQEMVERLPFVEAAWFEMDAPESSTAFQKTKMSAVISIRPAPRQWLLDRHVDTVRQMISGAVSGLAPEQIVVIDLSSGFAHRNGDAKTPADRRLDQRRAMSARQQVLTTRLQESLAIYPGVAVAVQFEMPVEFTGKTEAADSPDRHPDLNSLNQSNTAAAEPVAGANGQASIDDIPFAQLINQPVATAVAAPVAESLIATLHPRVSVTFDVPYEIAERYAAGDTERKSKSPRNGISDAGFSRSTAVHDDGYRRDEFGELAAIKSEIESIVRPVLDQELEASFPEAETQFSFRLLPPQAAVVSKSWQAKVQKVAEDNWPSLAVLVLGLVLIMLVAQTDSKARESASVDANVNSEILPFHSDGGTEGMASRITTGRGFANQRHDSESPENNSSGNNQHSNHSLADKEDAETRLAQLIESDPEAAAKVIESWIRDAA